ncbi:MAG: hypothetical protein JWO08_4706, partial [Verrucomicrobiaceae bacterium]|nr:hypothetical protein [Verrucomicrobiaceae bacterium]
MLRSNATVSRRGLSTVLFLSLTLVLCLLSSQFTHAQTWSATAASDNWSVGTNWAGGVAPVTGGQANFAASTRLTSNNDITGLNLTVISFGATAGAYVVTGNQITLGGDFTDSSTAQINFNAALLLTSLRTFNVTNALGDLVVGSVVSGTNSGVTMSKAGKGALTFTNANTYTGLTDIQDGMFTLSGVSGSLVLGTGIAISNGATFRLLNTAAASNTNRIADTQAISLTSGNIQFSHTGGAANYSETTGVLTLASGVNTITASQADPGQTSALTFASLNRTGGVINFAGTGLGDDTRNRIAFTSLTANDGIIGGYATAGSDFAKYDTSIGSVRAMQSADYTTTAQNTWASTSNVMLTGSATLSASRQINSLNIAAAAPTIADLGNNTLRVESGGLLLSGTSAITLQHGTLTAGEGTNAAGTLYLHQNSSAPLTMGARITNNGTGAVTLVKAGAGNLNLAEANTYTGPTLVYAGTLRSMVTNALPGTTALTLGDASGSAANLDATGVSQSLSGLSVLGNTSTVHAITVTAGETMNITGAINIGANVFAATTTTTFLGGGTLTVNNPGGLIQLGLATGNITYNAATLDLSSLSSVNINLGTTGTTTTSLLRIGDNNSTSGSGASTLKLAPNSTITALRISLGGETGSGANQTLALGTGTNLLNTGTLDVGASSTSAGARGIGVVNFLSTTNGTLKLRGVDGTSAASTLNVGYATVATTSGTLGATFDTRGHNADILVTTLNIGGRTTGTGISNTTFDFDKGTLAATTTVIGMKGSANTNITSLTGVVTFGGGTVNLGNVTVATNGSGAGAAIGTAVGTLNVSGGTVTLGSLAMASTSNATGTATGTLNLTGGDVILNGAITRIGGAGTNNAIVTLNGATLDMRGNTIGTSTSAVTFNAQSGIAKNLGAINGTSGLTKSGAGTLELQGSNSYSGPTTVTAGILKVATISNGGAASTLGSSASDAAGVVLNGGTLQYTGATGSSNRLFSVGTAAGSALDASGTGPLSLGTAGAIGLNGQTGTRTLTLTGTNTDDNLLAASLGDDGVNASSLTKAGIGTWVLTGTHSYTGTTTVNAGKLRLDFSGASAPSANIIGSTSALALGGGTLEIKGVSGGSPTQAFASLAVNAGASVLSTSLNGATSLTVNFGGASIVRSAGGTVNFQPSATNSFTTTNAVNNAASILGGYALINGTDWAARDGSGNITALATYTPLTTAATNANTANYSLSGGQNQLGVVTVNSLKLTGTGTLAMGANALTFTGGAGGLLYAPAGCGDTYNITGSAVVGSGTTSEFIVSVNQGTLNIANPLVSSTATAGSMTKAGAGTLVSTGTSLYTGATWVNGGVLEISGTGTINSATGSVIVAPGGTLRVNSSNAAGAVADGAAVTLTGTLDVRANETIGGLSGAGTVTNNGAVNTVLTANSSSTTTNFSGVLQDGSTNTLGLTKAGTLVLTLSGTASNTHTGLTTVSAGTLSLAKTGGALAISGNV